MNKQEPEEEVFLSADPEIPGQKFCLLSFVSPEDVLKNKDVFFFQTFVNQFEVNMKTKMLESFLAKTVQSMNDRLENNAVEFEKKDLSGVATDCRNAKIKIDSVFSELNDFVKSNMKEFAYDNIKEKYDDFMSQNRSKLENDFYIKNEFRTSIRSLKVRGVFGSHEEATAYSKRIHKQDKYFHIYVAQVGQWLPWNPDPNDIRDNEYADEQLNTLMKKYKENQDAREEFYRENKKTVNKVTKPLTNNVEHSDMFSSVGDLALQRKMNKSTD